MSEIATSPPVKNKYTLSKDENQPEANVNESTKTLTHSHERRRHSLTRLHRIS
jgi:hypothetical protein